MLNVILKKKCTAGIEFCARVFIKLGFTPNGLTIFGFIMGLVTCCLFLWNHNAILFGSLMLFWGMFDVMDGAVARITHKSSKFGSYLDAMTDRLYEVVAVFAVAHVSGHWSLALFAISGALLTSYAKARAAMEVAISNTEWPDLVERFERSLIFTGGVILWGCFPGNYGGQNIAFWTLLIINIFVYGGLIQRFFRAKRIIEERS